MLGLQRGTVVLVPHQSEWESAAAETIAQLRAVLGDTAVDIQHVGSTAIRTICAKPILDIAVGVREPEDVMRFAEPLAEIGIRCSKRDVAEKILFVMGDFAQDTRTHHIHVVQWGGAAWHNSLNFRDYLNAFPEKAKEYQERKRTLAAEFADARGSYTAGKQTLIESLLKEAADWRKMRAGTRVALAEVARQNAMLPFHGFLPGQESNLQPIVRHFPRWNLAGADRLWCAAFVYYCCVEAGFSIPARPRECVSGNLAGCLCWEEFALGDPRIEYHPRGDRAFSPACGDIVLYDRVFIDCEHDPIGIVLEVQGDSLTAAEGNTFHDNISRLVERKRDDHIRAYIRLPDHYRYEE